MRALIVSTISLCLLIGGWAIFYNYSDNHHHEMINDCDNIVMAAVENEDWDKAYDQFKQVYDHWHKYRKKALLFLDTQTVNDTDCSFAKTLKYIKAEDVSNGSGELLGLREQLKSLHLNESISLQNIL